MRKVKLPEFDLARTVNIGCSDVVKSTYVFAIFAKSKKSDEQTFGPVRHGSSALCLMLRYMGVFLVEAIFITKVSRHPTTTASQKTESL